MNSTSSQMDAADGHDEEAMRRAVRDFVDRKVIPTVRERDHTGTYAADLLEDLKQIGLPALPVPREHEGLGASITVCAQIFTELGRGWIALADMLSPHFAAANLLSSWGSPTQKDEFLPPMARGDDFGAIALTEPGAGTDLRNVEMTATRVGESYLLNGTKTMITHASHAATILTLCQVEDESRNRLGLGVVVLRPRRDDGVNTSGAIEKLGHRGVDLGEVVCESARVPASRLLGERPGNGLAQVMSAVNDGRIYVGAGAVGLGERALELALKYTRQREAYSAPLAELPVVRGRLGDMWIKVAAARAMIGEAARSADRGAPKRERARLAAAAKVTASEAATEVALTAMQLHGGYGYTTEFDIERIYRDVPLTTIGEGANDVLRQSVAGWLFQ